MSNNFCFGTKAETLENLSSSLSLSSVPELLYFTVNDWETDCVSIKEKICKEFSGEVVIVRSSALSEDGDLNAMAGVYTSVLNVNPHDEEYIDNAVNEVIRSYMTIEAEMNGSHQILVQKMVGDVSMSGVLFTQDINTGAPYFVINYDDETGRTDTISSGDGYCNRTLFIHRESWRKLSSPRFLKLIEAVKEIEDKVVSDTLDVEFAMNQQLEVFILQVRKITTRPNWNRGITVRVNEYLEGIRNDINNILMPEDQHYGSKTVLGRMPDWNPAEIIGSAPRPLAMSLYRYLITDKTWRISRHQMGYHEPTGMPLMLSLAGQPFIDVRMSFNSFLPEGLPPALADKLVNTWVDTLINEPDNHDKVEFNISITAHTFDFDSKAKSRLSDVFSQDEIGEFKAQLLNLTNALLTGAKGSLAEQLKKIDVLDKKRRKICSQPGDNIESIRMLLDQCIEYGTIPFSILARHAFIAEDFLRSLKETGIFDENMFSLFKASIPTVASQFLRDLDELSVGKIDKKRFVERYGHLRPGTYDILSSRYSDHDELVSSNQSVRKVADVESYELPSLVMNEIDSLLKKNDYAVNSNELIDYIRTSIQAREYSKFIFTRNISEALELLKNWGQESGLSNEEISYLSIENILKPRINIVGTSKERYFKKLSEAGNRNYEVTQALKLPQLIVKESDLSVIPLMIDQPNFISDKIVRSKWTRITSTTNCSDDLDGTIVLIESADPGFDWIFTRGIKGLITKYGGVNSHMSIRCAEFCLPAAIGCGEQIFDRICKHNAVELNCAEGRIVPLH